MFAVVAAETTGRIDVAEIVWVGLPVNLLVMEDGAVVNGLNFNDGLLDLFAVLAVYIE